MDMALDAQADTPDEELLARFAAGEPTAARALTLRMTPVALRVAQRMLGDRAEAEDVAQEAMLRLWRMAPDWRPGTARLSTWLYRVTANLCTDRLRRRRTLGLEAADAVADAAPGVVQAMITGDRIAALEAALLTLPDRQRQAVVLRHLEGLSNPEIADILGLGVEAVESLTARGKRALAAQLAQRREDLGYGED